MSTSWHSYPKVYNIGHKAVREIFDDPVFVQTKTDGSQTSFGVFDGELKFKSKNKEWSIHEPSEMFDKGIEYLVSVKDKMVEGYTYRAEYLMRPKHNTIAYDRVPKNNFMLFDVNTGHEEYVDPHHLNEHASRLGIEATPLLYIGKIDSKSLLERFLDRESVLGGAKIEGVVVKNYERFTRSKKAMMAKMVRKDFRERNGDRHKKEQQRNSPKGIKERISDKLRNENRWKKAVQRLRDNGELQEAPQDIGPLMRSIKEDIKEEEEEYIKDKLFSWAWKDIRKRVTYGFPEWYKEQLASNQFDDGKGE